MMTGTGEQRAMVHEALDRWWGPLMQMHGPRSDPAKDRDLYWRIKAKSSEELRQEFLSIYVPRLWELGLTIPDPELHLDEASGSWSYGEPDWAELKSVVTGHGPKSQERLEFRRLHYADTQWVRRILAGTDDPAREEANLNARQPIGRLLQPREIAHAIAYLASPLASATTGVALGVDGGMHSLRPPAR